MKALQVAEDILPIAEFKARASELVRGLRKHGRPMVVTQNGKPAAVVLSPDEFDRLCNQARFVAAVNEGLSDIDAGRVVSDDEMERSLDAAFGQRKR